MNFLVLIYFFLFIIINFIILNEISFILHLCKICKHEYNLLFNFKEFW